MVYFWLKDYDRALEDFNRADSLGNSVDYALASRALMYAASSDPKYRDGKKAVELAKKAVELNLSVGHYLALAAAYAECGNFTEAVRWQESAMTVPCIRDDPDMKARLELYRSGKPYRQP